MHVHVDAAGHDELPRGVNLSGAAGDDEVVTHEPDHAILTKIDRVIIWTSRVIHSWKMKTNGRSESFS